MRLHPDVTKENIGRNYSRSIKAYLELPAKIKSIHGNKYSLKFSTYKDAKVNIKVYCKTCKKLFNIRPNNLKQGQGCNRCSHKRNKAARTKTHKQYVQDLKEVNPYVEVLGTYTNSRTKINHRCLLCNLISGMLPSSKLEGQRNNCCTQNNLDHLLEEPAKLYTFKITKGRRVAYKIGVTSKKNIVGTDARYMYRQDIKNISQISFIEFKTLEDALKIESHYKYHNNQNKKYNGKVGLLKGMGNTELFKYKIDLKEFISSTV